MSTLDVFLLGTVDLASAMELQERLRADVAAGTGSRGAILLCEHPPCVTIGRDGSFADVLVEREELTARRMDVRWLNRGGGTFVHLPGQLAVYTILPLERMGMGLLQFRTALEKTLIATAADLKVPAERASDSPGALCRCGQFAFIGAAVRDWVSHGGMFINVSLPQEALDLIRWTHTETRVTTLAAQRTRPTAMSTVRESLARNLATALGSDSYHVYTGHPFLHRTTQKVYVYA
ncbi:lipoyl(octanoyl) transferase LipB [Schlesneria sp. DSM 10557]|uniref:lipoyl(octanoyl) transferase LipB n=1 Tax=Schlesneria sp. DSM 10557 TaxID=3044399 RepID=UPI0035A0B4F2